MGWGVLGVGAPEKSQPCLVSYWLNWEDWDHRGQPHSKGKLRHGGGVGNGAVPQPCKLGPYSCCQRGNWGTDPKETPKPT